MFAFIKKLFGVKEVVQSAPVDTKVETANAVPYKVEAPVVATPAPVAEVVKAVSAPAKKKPAAKKAPVAKKAPATAKKPTAKTQKPRSKPAV